MGILGAARHGQGWNNGAKSRHFRPCARTGLATVQAVNHPARPCCVRIPPLGLLLHAVLLLCALVGVAGAAHAQTAAGKAIDTDVAERVRALVSANLQVPAVAQPSMRLAIEVGRLDPRLQLAPCRRVEPQLPPLSALWGRTRIGLRCVEGDRNWQVWLPVEVKVFAPALVSARPLAAGTVLGAEHLQQIEVDWAAQTQPPLARSDELIGRTLGRAVPAGQALRSADLRQRQWFAAGDTVTVRARGDGFTVSGEGQALGHGIEGQSVRVRTESGRVLSGRPVADHQVEVQL